MTVTARDDYPVLAERRDAYIDGNDDLVGLEASRLLREVSDLRDQLAQSARVIADRDAWLNYLSRRGKLLGYVVAIPDDSKPLSWDGELHFDRGRGEASLTECAVEWPSAVLAAVVADVDVACDTCGDSGRCTYPSIEAQAPVVVACPDCGGPS